MIQIINVSPDASPRGENLYEVRVNDKPICGFKHMRYPGQLAACLREAADAVDREMERRTSESLLNVFKQSQ